MEYRRATAAGGCYFFTVNLADRSADTLVQHIAELRAVMQRLKQSHPFSIVAMGILPEHTQYGACRRGMRITRCAGH